MKHFLKKLKNNKGAGSVITRMWSMLILFFAAMFVIDVLVFVVNVTVTGYQTMYVARILSTQGGFIGSGSSIIADCNQVSIKTNDSWKYNQEILQIFDKVTGYCGIDPGDWSLKVIDCNGQEKYIYRNGTKPGDATSYVSPARCLKNPSNPLTYAQKHGTIETIQFHYDYVWRFFPIFRMADLSVPMTISFNYRTEYVRG